MNIFSVLLDIIRRNPLSTVLFIMIIIAAPGLLGVFAIFLLIPLIFIVIAWVAMSYRLRRVKKTMEQQMHNTQSGTTGSSSRAHTRSSQGEGKVTVHIPHQEQKVSDDVGEYVSFKEVDEK